MHPILNHHEIRADLEERCLQLANHHVLIFGNSGSKSAIGQAVSAAIDMAEHIALPGGNATAQAILTALVPELERRGTDFWGTPLGRACGWWTGAGQEDASGGELLVVTPQPRVALLLGMSRQSAFEMVTRGKLKKLSPTGVDPADVRREMQARYPL